MGCVTSRPEAPGSERARRWRFVELTLRLQPVDDRGGGDDDRRAQAADALLGRLADAAQVRVGVFGAGVDGRHQAVGGADQGEAADPLHQVLHRDTNPASANASVGESLKCVTQTHRVGKNRRCRHL